MTESHLSSNLSNADRSRALLLLTLSYFIAFLSTGAQVVWMTQTLLAAGLSASSVGLLWSLRSFTQVLTPPIWGSIADKAGTSRPAAVITHLVGALALLLLVLAPSNFWWCAFLFIAFGFFGQPSTSMIDGMTLTALGTERHRYGDIRLFGSLGFGAAALGGQLLVDTHVFTPMPEVVFPLMGVFMAIAGVIMWRVPNMPRSKMTSWREMGDLLHDPVWLGMVVLGIAQWAGHSAYSIFLPTLAEKSGIAPWAVGVSVAVAVLVEAVLMRLSAGWLRRFGAYPLLLLTALSGIVRWTLLALIARFQWGSLAFVASHALHGLTFGLFYAVLVSSAAERIPERLRQTSQSMLSAIIFGGGGALGSTLCGQLLEHGTAASSFFVSGTEAVWWGMAVCGVIALLITASFGRHLRAGGASA